MGKDSIKDPQPYDGPIARADGERPFNMFLWPRQGEWWHAAKLDHRLYGWHFGIVALADGRFATVGHITDIEIGTDSQGLQVVFPNRIAAVRASCSRMIRKARNSRAWGPISHKLEGARLSLAINWARDIVAREAGKQPPKPVSIADQRLQRAKTGLPLFDFETMRTTNRHNDEVSG